MPAPVSATSTTACPPSTRVAIVSQPPLRHGVARVEEQVQEDLLQLVLDAAHDQRVGGEARLRTWTLPLRNWCSSSESTSAMTALQVDRRRSSVCARPRQVEQAVDDLGGAERLPLDLLEQLGPRVVRIGALEQHLREARDAGQRRVHLVRDAGGEQADRGHLLRDLQLLLELHARR